jgi:hypothetical protein
LDNLARVINLVISAGSMQPCIRVNRSVEIAARQYNASFKVEMSFTYTHNGVVQPAVTSNPLITATTFIAALDTRWVRVRGPAITVLSIDHGTNVSCSAQLTILDNAGARIEACDAEFSIIRVP